MRRNKRKKNMARRMAINVGILAVLTLFVVGFIGCQLVDDTKPRNPANPLPAYNPTSGELYLNVHEWADWKSALAAASAGLITGWLGYRRGKNGRKRKHATEVWPRPMTDPNDPVKQ